MPAKLKKHHRQRTISPALIQAFNHPLRRQILRSIHESPNSSPSGLIRSIQATLSNISYHMKVLHELGVVKCTGTKPVRGATEHSYDSLVTDNKLCLFILNETAKDDKALRRPK